MFIDSFCLLHFKSEIELVMVMEGEQEMVVREQGADNSRFEMICKQQSISHMYKRKKQKCGINKCRFGRCANFSIFFLLYRRQITRSLGRCIHREVLYKSKESFALLSTQQYILLKRKNNEKREEKHEHKIGTEDSEHLSIKGFINKKRFFT